MTTYNTKIEYVEIPHDIIVEVERRHFEFCASQQLIGYLMSRPDTQEHLLQKYLDSSEKKFVELELMKNAVVEQYPSTNGYRHYMFDFGNSCIKYAAEESELND